MEKHTLLFEAQGLSDYIIHCRRSLHRLAETGFDTRRSLDFIASELSAMGIRAADCGKAGLVALIGGEASECFLLRADIDALPIPERSGLPFAAQNGNCHACGHDAHAAMLLGAAKILKNHESELSSPVKLMFQSAEETLEGAKDMIEAGVLHSPRVGGAMMLHLMTGQALPSGSIIVPEPGVSTPSADYFQIEVKGHGCHGSSPNTGVDPINAAAHIIIALQELKARELAMDEQAVLTIGSIQGGEAANAIPDNVGMGGTLRAYNEDTRDHLKTRLVEISQAVASAFRASAFVRFGSGCPGLSNDKALVLYAGERAREVLGGERVFRASDFASASGRGGRTAGSEDFAYVSRAVPSVMLALAAGETEKGFDKPLHHPAVTFDEAAMPYGSAVLAQCALRWQSTILP